MSNATIAGVELHNLPTINSNELNGDCFVVCDTKQKNGRFKTGKVKFQDFNTYLAGIAELPNRILTSSNFYLYVDFNINGEVALDAIFGNFESPFKYEVMGMNIFLNSPPNGATPDKYIELKLYDRTNGVTIGEPIKSGLAVRTTTEYYFNKPTFLENKKYGMKVTYLKTIAPVKDLNVQLILRPIVAANTVHRYGGKHNLQAVGSPPSGLNASTSAYAAGSMWINNAAVPIQIWVATEDSFGVLTWLDLLSGLTAVIATSVAPGGPLAAALSSAGSAISGLQATVGSHGSWITNLNNLTASHGSTLGNHSTYITNLNNLTASHGSTLGNHSTYITNLNNLTASHGSTLGNHSTYITNLNNLTASQGSSITNLTTLTTNQGNSITNLNNLTASQGSSINNLLPTAPAKDYILTSNSPTTATWKQKDTFLASALPPQANQAGKVLTTDGTNTSWQVLGAGFKNMLINGNFEIWQRQRNFSLTNFSTDITTADRWMVHPETGSGNPETCSTTTNKVNLSIPEIVAYGHTDALDLTVHSTLTGMILGQIVETVPHIMVNKSYTVSFWARASVPHTIIVTMDDQLFSPSIALTTTYTKYYATIAVSNSGGNPFLWNDRIAFRFRLGTTVCSYRFGQVQLEQGNIPTAFEFRPRVMELQFCQRYFFSTYYAEGGLPGDISINTTQFIGKGDDFDSTALWGSFLFPVVMRIKPHTITFYRPSTGRKNYIESVYEDSENLVRWGTEWGTTGLFMIRVTDVALSDRHYQAHFTVNAEY